MNCRNRLRSIAAHAPARMARLWLHHPSVFFVVQAVLLVTAWTAIGVSLVGFFWCAFPSHPPVSAMGAASAVILWVMVTPRVYGRTVKPWVEPMGLYGAWFWRADEHFLYRTLCALCVEEAQDLHLSPRAFLARLEQRVENHGWTSRSGLGEGHCPCALVALLFWVLDPEAIRHREVLALEVNTTAAIEKSTRVFRL